MKARIINKKINTDDFKYNDIVEIVSNNAKVLGKSVKTLFHVNIDEVVIKKINTDSEHPELLVMTKCYKHDLKLIREEGGIVK